MRIEVRQTIFKVGLPRLKAELNFLTKNPKKMNQKKQRKQLTLPNETWAKLTALAGSEMIKNSEAFADQRGDVTLRYVEMLLKSVVENSTMCSTCGDASVEILI